MVYVAEHMCGGNNLKGEKICVWDSQQKRDNITINLQVDHFEKQTHSHIRK